MKINEREKLESLEKLAKAQCEKIAKLEKCCKTSIHELTICNICTFNKFDLYKLDCCSKSMCGQCLQSQIKSITLRKDYNSVEVPVYNLNIGCIEESKFILDFFYFLFFLFLYLYL